MASNSKCSFCGKAQEHVRKLIAAPGVYICDECVYLCNEILAEEVGLGWCEEMHKARRRIEIAEQFVSDQTVSKAVRDAAEKVLIELLS